MKAGKGKKILMIFVVQNNYQNRYYGK